METIISKYIEKYLLVRAGSTGRPKGVIQSYQNILHFIDCYTDQLTVTHSDSLTLFSAFSHDAAVMDIYGGLLNGATLYPLNIKEFNLGELAEWLITEKITIYHSVPTVYRYFIRLLKERGDRKEWAFPVLKYIVLGGEEVREDDIVKFRERFSNTNLVNLYGQSESSFNAAFMAGPDTNLKKVTLGRPVKDTEILIVDDEGEDVEVLGIGEIVIASDYVALGYWNDEVKTVTSFGERYDLGRFYRTGDLGRLLLDGSIEFLGRKDSQIKIRGYRVELGEIESQLLKYDRIQDIVVVVKEDKNGNQNLCVYFTSESEISTGILRADLAQSLPDYMVPTYFIRLQKLPLLSNNKIDKKALPEPERSIIRDDEFIPSRNDSERRLAELWSKVLAIDFEQIGVNDSFFDLGGNSLKIMELASLMNNEYKSEVKIVDLFNYNTLMEMVNLIDITEEESKRKIMKFTF